MRQGLRLEPLMQGISDFLDDQKDMIEQVRCDLTRGLKKAETGRSGLTPQQILRSLVLMRIKNWDYRELSQGRDLSTLASLRALWARTPKQAWARRAVGEGVKFCPRAGCGKSACPVR